MEPVKATAARAPATGRVVRVGLDERSYDITIRPGVLDEIGRYVQALGFSGRIGIVTNPAIGRRYARRVMRSLKGGGYLPRLITVPEGEKAKSLRWVAAILDRLAADRFERGSALIALGGGVIGDLTGFAAAVYLRGIAFVQVPTTLVAQVDSSVGGKTGVNHALGKNLIGAFHQPRLVLVDPQTLHTLPAREWKAGLAEVIKYGVIADAELFAYLEQNVSALLRREEDAIVHVVARSCEIKAGVVMQDERESGLRRILNYGHTVGHALEALGGYRALIHGEAVAIGMAQEAALARQTGLCEERVVGRQRELIRAAGLPVDLPRVTFTRLWDAMRHDKKVAQGRIHCVFPTRIGEVVVRPLERAVVQAWFAGLRRRQRHASGPRGSGRKH